MTAEALNTHGNALFPMSNDGIIAPRFVLLADALQPLLVKVDAQLNEPTRPVRSDESFFAVADGGLGRFSDLVERFCDDAQALGDLIGTADVPEAKVFRAVGRLEPPLEELLDTYAELRETRTHAAREQGRQLLVAALRHTLTQIRDWLRDVVDTAADPISVLKRKGLATSGNVNLDLTLAITTPKELDEFSAWAEDVAQAEEQRDRREEERASFWGGLAVFAAGIFLGGLFFGGDDD